MRKVIFFLMSVVIIINPILANQAFGQELTPPPTLISESAIVIESQTGKVLFEKDANTEMFPASLTKIATAIYAIENGDIDETVTVSEKARNTEGTRVYLEEGERVTLKKLIQGLLINSGNDAGVAIAEHLSGSVDRFATDLNHYLINEIGVEDTHFENPHGLFDSEHVTTAADLAYITQYAMKNDLFRDIFGTEELEWTGESWDTTLITHHKLMREMPYEGITGGKTGFVSKSGFTLATTAERDRLSVIVITLNSYLKSGSYRDTSTLLDYVFENFQTSSIPMGTLYKNGDLEYKTSENLYYTHAQDDRMKQEFKNGILKVMNQDDFVMASFPLEKVEKKEHNKIGTGGKVGNSGDKNPLFNDTFTRLVPVLFILLLTFIGFTVKRKYLEINK